MTEGKAEIMLPFSILSLINILPVKLKKEVKREILEKNFAVAYHCASRPKVFFSTMRLNSTIPSKSTAQARSPPSVLKIHHHDEVHRPSEDHRACEVSCPCEVPRPCEVHRVDSLLRKSTTPKHRKVPSLCRCVNGKCLGFSSERGFLTSQCSPFAGYSSI